MTEWLVARLQEGTTWRGIVWLLTALGAMLSPQAWEYIVTAGMAIAGLIGVLSSERGVSPTRPPLICPPTSYNDRDSNVSDAPVPSPQLRVGQPVSVSCANHPEADDRCVVRPGADRCRPDADRVRSNVPTVPNFGVRPPIERTLDDQFSGGWGDR